MDITIQPVKLHGSVAAISSKSQAHRLLICSAIADGETILICPETNRDIEATAECLQALGADIRRMDGYYRIFPIQKVPETAVLNCCESGSTLRFFIPIALCFCENVEFEGAGRLMKRPLKPYFEIFDKLGIAYKQTSGKLQITGKLTSGEFHLDGTVSSQFLTGLLFALPCLEGDSRIIIEGGLSSKGYIDITLDVL